MSSKIKRAVIGSYHRFYEFDLAFKSAGLAFYQLFSLIPLVALLMIVSGYLATDDQISQQLISLVKTIFNNEASDRLIAIIQSFELKDQLISYSVTSVILFIYSITVYFARLREYLHQVADSAWTRPNNFISKLRSRIIGFGYFLVVFISMSLIAITSVLIEYFSDQWVNQGLAVGQELGLGLTTLVSYVILLSVIYLMNRSISRDFVSRSKALLISSIGTGLAITISYLFGYFLQASPTLSNYGALSALLGIVLWLFLINAVLLVNASVLGEIALDKKVRTT